MMLTKGTNFLNRECTWVNFNERVLHEADDDKNPLLEKLNFLAISASNLDEFFMIRMAGVKHLIESGIKHIDMAGMSPTEQFDAIEEMVHRQVSEQYEFFEKIKDGLKEKGIVLASVDELNDGERTWLDDYVEREVYPVVTPLAVDASHPVPFLTSLSLNLAVLLRRKNDGTGVKAAVFPVPTGVSKRIIALPPEGRTHKFVLLEDVLSDYAGIFFRGCEILETVAFRITRDADLEINNEAEDLLTEIKKSLKKRRKGAAVRLEVSSHASRTIKHFLKSVLRLHEGDVYSIPGPLDLKAFFALTGLAGFEELHYPAAVPQPVKDLLPFSGQSIWDSIRTQNIMMHHPYETFAAVDAFICMAAKDPQVLAIKQTLYRVSAKSAIIAALADAARNGKQVTVLMEVKARFDEENNINMARRLEEAGCHVIYGIVGLKTHSKITLVVRREKDGIRRYLHLATGNYNGKTARIYTDVGIFTCDPLMGMDASAFFNVLSGYSDAPQWHKLGVAPFDLRERLYEAIDREIKWVGEGKKGLIVAKMNSLVDKKVINRLYEASQAGVVIRLIIRGICVLRPGLAGVSENITVHSIVGRFLEHSRLFYFYNNGEEDVFLSSADWMPRNLNERIELLVPIEYGPHKERIKEILRLNYEDNVNGHVMNSDGTYTLLDALTTDGAIDAQAAFQKEAETREEPVETEN